MRKNAMAVDGVARTDTDHKTLFVDDGGKIDGERFVFQFYADTLNKITGSAEYNTAFKPVYVGDK